MKLQKFARNTRNALMVRKRFVRRRLKLTWRREKQFVKKWSFVKCVPWNRKRRLSRLLHWLICRMIKMLPLKHAVEWVAMKLYLPLEIRTVRMRSTVRRKVGKRFRLAAAKEWLVALRKLLPLRVEKRRMGFPNMNWGHTVHNVRWSLKYKDVRTYW